MMDSELHQDNITPAPYGANDSYADQLRAALDNATLELKRLADIIRAKDELIVKKDETITTLITQLHTRPSSPVPASAPTSVSNPPAWSPPPCLRSRPKRQNYATPKRSMEKPRRSTPSLRTATSSSTWNPQLPERFPEDWMGFHPPRRQRENLVDSPLQTKHGLTPRFPSPGAPFV